MVEALLVLGVLGSLAVGIAWLGRLQDAGLQLGHASRRVAFARAHQGLHPFELDAGVDGYLSGPGHDWNTRRGTSFLGAASLAAGPQATASVFNTGVAPAMQAGDPVTGASQWRAELRLGDAEVWRGEAGVVIGRPDATGTLRDFDDMGLTLRRHTAILTGAGAAESDEEVQRLLAESGQAWDQLAAVSRHRGRTAQQRLQGVDEAWARAQPDWDWVSGWAGQVPSRYLQPWRLP
ncbi:Pilus assembly protein OS=Castellaniella defragrans OX=75697 GN=HNR28_002323 PE=4 SV=1 [Castellaniella defragrans]